MDIDYGTIHEDEWAAHFTLLSQAFNGPVKEERPHPYLSADKVVVARSGGERRTGRVPVCAARRPAEQSGARRPADGPGVERPRRRIESVLGSRLGRRGGSR